MEKLECNQCTWTVAYPENNIDELEEALMDLDDHMNTHPDEPAAWTELDPWGTPPAWSQQWAKAPAAADWPPAPAEPKQIDCGRCGGSTRDAELLFHLSWKCEAQEAWIEAAINDRKARPDRYRQAKKDLGAKTLKDAQQALAALKTR